VITTDIKAKIVRKGRGYVFTPSDFISVGSRAAVDQALSRLAKSGVIRRLAQGIYDYPKVSPRLGPLSPKPDDVAKAVARKDGQVLSVSPAKAANMLGLTTQVPAKLVYLTNGPTRSKTFGGQTIYLRNAAAKNLAGVGTPVGLIFQALRYVGKDGIDTDTLKKLSRHLTADDLKALLKDSHKAPDWMRPVAKDIARFADMAA